MEPPSSAAENSEDQKLTSDLDHPGLQYWNVVLANFTSDTPKFQKVVEHAKSLAYATLPPGLSPTLGIDRDLINTLLRNEVGMFGYGQAKTLDLTGRSDLIPNALRLLLFSLKKSHSVSSVNMASMALGDEGAKLLSRGLEQDQHSVVSLDITDNGISDVGFTYVAAMLLQTSNMTLERLYANFNFIGHQGCHVFAETLGAGLVPLEVIDLSNNPIGDEGVISLARHLVTAAKRHPSHLRHFALNNCNIGDPGLLQLAAMVPHVTSLQLLEVADNVYGDDGVRALQEVAAHGLEVAVNKNSDLAFFDMYPRAPVHQPVHPKHIDYAKWRMQFEQKLQKFERLTRQVTSMSAKQKVAEALEGNS
ncbi:hypothetical protein CYMTET_50284 [Cymbomonas tetramitiformis]|uniref:Uncharacterized protein n=1 Tax=Cymbomonas tetramitiformis TaxID=36881 RepID=A0AAE0BND0_9CHLO|nr:hypothetical protein CYMTET_50284 [Cymbomonas tetramitiformis]